jgi:hypothetical protein
MGSFSKWTLVTLNPYSWGRHLASAGTQPLRRLCIRAAKKVIRHMQTCWRCTQDNQAHPVEKVWRRMLIIEVQVLIEMYSLTSEGR